MAAGLQKGFATVFNKDNNGVLEDKPGWQVRNYLQYSKNVRD